MVIKSPPQNQWGSDLSVCTATPLCMWHHTTMIPDSYLNIQIVWARSWENRRRPSIYSRNVPNGPDPYHLAPVFLFQRRSPYGACFPRYSLAVQNLLYKLFWWTFWCSTWNCSRLCRDIWLPLRTLQYVCIKRLSCPSALPLLHYSRSSQTTKSCHAMLVFLKFYGLWACSTSLPSRN